MEHFTATVRALSVTLRHLFRRPTTVHYPMEQRERADRMRASFALVHDEHGEEACIACFACERICPSEIITVTAGGKRESPVTGKKRGYLEDFTLDMQACIICELCVQVCPTDAILMTRETEEPGYAREDLLLTMEKLYANEEKKTTTWATATKLMETQDPKRGQPKPVKKPKPKPKPAEEKPAEPKVEAAPAPEKPEEPA